jgi:hypothetical protein
MADPRTGDAVRFQCAESFAGRSAVFAGVIADHAVGVYEWAKRADRRLHALNPLARNSVGPAIVEGGNDIALQQIVERLSFHPVRSGVPKEEIAEKDSQRGRLRVSLFA